MGGGWKAWSPYAANLSARERVWLRAFNDGWLGRFRAGASTEYRRERWREAKASRQDVMNAPLRPVELSAAVHVEARAWVVERISDEEAWVRAELLVATRRALRPETSRKVRRLRAKLEDIRWAQSNSSHGEEWDVTAGAHDGRDDPGRQGILATHRAEDSG